MVDWTSPAELVLDGGAFTKLIHALLGLYIWEWLVSLDFDLAYLLRRRRFQWPLTFYFLGRYSMLIALVGVVIGLNVNSEINCQALFIFSQTFGNLAIAMSATNLSIRTIAVWGRSLYIVIPLSVALVVYAGILLRGVIGVRDIWVPGAGCTIVNSQIVILRTIYIYGMSLDFIVMCLTVFKLATSGASKTPLVVMLVQDGLLYFAISFTANTIAVIFMMLNLNAVMGVIADVPAVVICTIAACRVVRRLTNRGFSDQSHEVFSPASNSVRLTTRPYTDPASFAPSKDQGDRFQMSDIELPETPSTMRTAYDAAGRIVTPGSEDIDLEAQAMSAEFNTPECKSPTSSYP